MSLKPMDVATAKRCVAACAKYLRARDDSPLAAADLGEAVRVLVADALAPQVTDGITFHAPDNLWEARSTTLTRWSRREDAEAWMKGERKEAAPPVDLTPLEKAAEAFLAKWPEVERRISGVFILQFVRSGVQYDGPNIGAEIEALRRGLDAARRADAGGGT